ncbi:MAG TPA: carbon-nitrogen family hydrolase [Anaerolineales bacterium]|nr:carbon-nitrogen family hydrolase [Anaerolineales bacterium]
MNKLTLSLAQMHIELGNPEANFEQAAHWISEAAGRGSDLVLLPELWSTGYDLENWARHATPIGEGLFPRVAALAHEYRLSVGGSLLEANGGRAYNTFVLYDRSGNLVGKYCKIHLFRLMDEHNWLTPGEELVTGQFTPTSNTAAPVQAGMGICYDLRFPELWRSYALSGLPLALLPAEWPAARVYHWRTLLRARAIENQMFVAATNNVGVTKNETFGGHSAVIDPWGEVLVEGSDQEELLTTEIDLQKANEVRNRIPVFKDRRPEIYDFR